MTEPSRSNALTRRRFCSLGRIVRPFENELSAGSEKGKIDATRYMACSDDWDVSTVTTTNLERIQPLLRESFRQRKKHAPSIGA
jgi:hypothetical protein